MIVTDYIYKVPTASPAWEAGSSEPASWSWKDVPALPPFLCADGQETAAYATTTRVCADATKLYVRFDCEDYDIWGNYTKRDQPIYDEEVVELFLAPGSADPTHYYEFEVSPNGVLFDAKIINEATGRADIQVIHQWDCAGIQWWAERYDAENWWTAVLIIPWSSVALPGKLPKNWRAIFIGSNGRVTKNLNLAAGRPPTPILPTSISQLILVIFNYPSDEGSMRVVIGGISHETSTFTPVETNWNSYYERFFLRGEDIVTTFRGTNTPLGGFIDGAAEHNFELLPTLFAEPHPSGPTPRAIFDAILLGLLNRIEAAGDIDGILLELHGSMVVGELDGPDGLDDGEGYILTAIRQRVGSDVPIVAQLDIHANVSPQMVAMADVLIGRETYPEIDMAARGGECADVLVRMVREGLRPTMALHQIPMVWGMHQVTEHAPMKEAIAELHRIEAQPDVICGSIAVCYFLADVPHMGASVYVVTDNDQALAQRYADELGAWAFARRADWHYELPTTQEALRLAEENGRFPVVFADSRDNTGGGAPGDSTGMLRTFLEAGLQDACLLYIVDPEAIAKCKAAGAGATLTLDIGGKSSPLQGQPVTMTVEVMGLSDGRFHYDGPMYTGLEGKMGPSAYIRQDGLHIILVTVGEQPYDTAFARSLGLDPRQMRYIGVKSTAHFRAGFEPWAGAIYLVSEPSVHNLGHLPFNRLRRKLYPFDDI